jgi:hypothetical protein
MSKGQAKEEAKCWVQHSRTGSVGWLVKSEDPEKPIPGPEPGAMVRLHVPGPSQLRTYGDGKWTLRDSSPKMPLGTKATIAYRAIQELAKFSGDYASSTKDLSSFGDEQRIALFHNGPSSLKGKIGLDRRAQRLWDAVMAALADA